MHIGRHVKYPLFLSDFMDTLIFLGRFSKNPSSGSRVVPCERTDRQTDRQTDMTKLTVAFQNFENEPKSLDQHALLK